LSDTPGAVRMPAPRLGEHTDDVLEGVGFDQAALESLRAAKVIV